MVDGQSDSEPQRILRYAHRVAEAWDVLNRLWIEMEGVGPVAPALAAAARDQVAELQDEVQRRLGEAVRCEDAARRLSLQRESKND